MIENQKKTILRRLSKLTCLSTLLLIFIGGLVTSTGSGLSVPDWPLSYGMVFPPMVGGVFYEHGHRLAASVVGFLMLCLAIAAAKFEKRRWVRNLSFVGLGAVIAQGILGGITVKFFLPLWVSVSHGVLAQTFLLITVALAYSFSKERESKENENVSPNNKFLWAILVFILFVYVQLMIGAVMRHSHSGMAIPDFPTMGGEWWPRFDISMLSTVNDARFHINLEPVSIEQVFIHFYHRLGALVLVFALIVLNFFSLRTPFNSKIAETILLLNSLFIIQIVLGIVTVLSHKEYHFTSLHVMTGAAILASSLLLFLRTAPLKIKSLKKLLLNP